MSAWYDAIDWVGGYPFEVAKPEEVFDFLEDAFFLHFLFIQNSRSTNGLVRIFINRLIVFVDYVLNTNQHFDYHNQ